MLFVLAVDVTISMNVNAVNYKNQRTQYGYSSAGIPAGFGEDTGAVAVAHRDVVHCADVGVPSAAVTVKDRLVVPVGRSVRRVPVQERAAAGTPC
jgi:hypothetical protein